MKVGAVFPQTEAGADASFIRRYATRLEEAGCEHVVAYDHVLGHRPRDREAWERLGPYTDRDSFHEVMTLFAYMAGCTTRMGLATEVLVLPQRQTPLVAKQAAEVAILSGGRFRLGVGLGWNPAEFSGMGMRFDDRGRRVEEQIALLRRLLAEPLVSFSGHWERVEACGINPSPPPIPIWIGGRAAPALERAARLGDGLMLSCALREAPEVIGRVRELVAGAGRDPGGFGFSARLHLRGGEFAPAVEAARRWRDAGVTHLSVGTMGLGLPGPDDHIELTSGWFQAWREAEA